jgi:hypothetical protein
MASATGYANRVAVNRDTRRRFEQWSRVRDEPHTRAALDERCRNSGFERQLFCEGARLLPANLETPGILSKHQNTPMVSSRGFERIIRIDSKYEPKIDTNWGVRCLIAYQVS